MSRRTELYTFAALVVLLVFAGYYYLSSRNQVAGLPGVLAANTNFRPLDIQEPRLRLDLLEKIRKTQYVGSHRNIFVAAPPPPPAPLEPVARPFVGPRPAPPPPPLQVPAEFFGYASHARAGGRVAFFTSGDDVLIVHEGETFLGRFRLDRIGNDYADVEEISSSRHATVPLVQPPDQGSNQ
jgi:hypothetical protein